MNAPIAAYLKKAEGWAARARASRFFAAGLAGGVLVALLDQASKLWILNGLKLPDLPNGHVEISQLFDLTYVRNYGASFGMLNGTPLAPVILSLVAIGVTIALIHWLPGATRRLSVAGVALIMGGALGNLLDRLRYGYVVDFLNFSGFPFPHLARTEGFPFVTLFNGGFVWVFNVADAAINVGIALLIIDWLGLRKKAQEIA
ncbi:MAG: signal peptidase II [Parvularculaceae bacterium]